jgi:hypothetical protein
MKKILLLLLLIGAMMIQHDALARGGHGGHGGGRGGGRGYGHGYGWGYGGYDDDYDDDFLDREALPYDDSYARDRALQESNRKLSNENEELTEKQINAGKRHRNNAEVEQDEGQ